MNETWNILSSCLLLLVISSCWSHAEVRPNASSSYSNLAPNDPYWPSQWYLFKQNWFALTPVADMNVLGAWQEGVTGKGVRVAIIDSGINHNFDLAQKIIETIMIQPDRIPFKSHGTWVAGVIGARRNNGECGAGIAPGVDLLDVKIFPPYGQSSKPADEATGLQTRVDIVDIYHNSWTGASTGAHVAQPSQAVRDAVQKGITEGRGGRGAIYVWSAGNGGVPDSCAYDGYLNSPYVIVATGVDRNMKRLGTGESCSAIMVAAFSSDVTEKEKNPIITTDGTSGCTDTYGRSSAAAAMVTGAVALTLEANPEVTYRDVMHILTATSRHSVFSGSPDNGFVRNAAGMHVSPTFGFGLLDIGEMVKRAKSWKQDTIKPLASCSATIIAFPNIKSLHDTSFVQVNVAHCGIEKLEHVEVDFDGSFTARGDLKMTLTSPSRTSTVILSGRPMDFFRRDLKVKATAVTFWNEKANGIWRIDFEDLGQNAGSIRGLKLIFHGQTPSPATTTPQPTPKLTSIPPTPPLATTEPQSTSASRLPEIKLPVTTEKAIITPKTGEITEATPVTKVPLVTKVIEVSKATGGFIGGPQTNQPIEAQPSLGAGAIAGIVVALIAVLAIGIAIGVFCCRNDVHKRFHESFRRHRRPLEDPPAIPSVVFATQGQEDTAYESSAFPASSGGYEQPYNSIDSAVSSLGAFGKDVDFSGSMQKGGTFDNQTYCNATPDLPPKSYAHLK